MSSCCGKSRTKSPRLFRDLLINVTNFFRDAEAFESLAAMVIPKLFEAGAQMISCVSGCRVAPRAKKCIPSAFCCASTWIS